MNARAEIHHDMEGGEDDLQLDTLRGDIRDAMLNRIRHMKASWSLCNEAEQAETDSEEDPARGPAPRKPAKKRGRASVPSWDEIMFGGGKSD